MKLWIDDLRPAPPGDWVIARTSAEALAVLEEHAGKPIEEISFDHDLGGDDTTRRVLMWMIENDVWSSTVYIHTANPIGRNYLAGTARRYAPDWVKVLP
ncbi:cyclic-phosphate processing receiver domain-containing protein [Leifsonia sp. Leaf264]|uniref:cyclic-phosphate processing receiver domain-containing protein n=1 Tax=Leifsonia sp. Leaf264 TaxID=1736314 RepID=UPI0006F6856C|nr:cyclic-phosphate processing receiver domain-containing protein [Leifsonia sp. Leaf264]KQO98213.1 hypothetical protein ASF30_09130 [Leifsonia sp. Leaf264]